MSRGHVPFFTLAGKNKQKRKRFREKVRSRKISSLEKLRRIGNQPQRMTNSPLSRPSAAAMGQSLPGKPQTFLPAWMILQEARRNRWPSLEASIGPSSNPLLRSFGFGKKGLWLPFDFKAGLAKAFRFPQRRPFLSPHGTEIAFSSP
jgi:hypothetical protein